jgi:hypothetical protein
MPRSPRSRWARQGEGWGHGRIRSAVFSLATVGMAIALTACGSSNQSSSGSEGHVTYAQAQQDAVRFVGCMRSHGVSNLADPTSPHEFKISISPSSGVNPRSPAFESAETACRHLLPGGGPHSQSAARSRGQLDALLAFARCLRTHGFPGFPDPTSSGQVTHEMLAQAGINLHQPALLQAADACVSVTHGVITRTAVASFVAGQ